MANENCLAGRMCPNCGNDKRLQIDAFAAFVLTDDGAEYVGGDVEYDEYSNAVCLKCAFSGPFRHFSDRVRPAVAAYEPRSNVMHAIELTFCSPRCRAIFKAEHPNNATRILTDTLTDLDTHDRALWCTRCNERISIDE